MKIEAFTESLVCQKCGAFFGMSRRYCPGCDESAMEHLHLDCGCGFKRLILTKDAPECSCSIDGTPSCAARGTANCRATGDTE